MCFDRLLPGVCGNKVLCAPIGCCREWVEVRLCVLRSLVAGCVWK